MATRSAWTTQSRPGRPTWWMRWPTCSSRRASATPAPSSAAAASPPTSGKRLDKVLIQLGLVSERGLAEAFATLLGLPLADPRAFPATEPAVRGPAQPPLPPPARALPVARGRGRAAAGGGRPAGPLHRGRGRGRDRLPGVLLVGVPIELDAALDRLYPDADQAAPAAAGEGAERGRCRAAEGPGQRGAGDPAGQPASSPARWRPPASDIHIEPFEDRLRVRYRYDGVLHEADSPPARLAAAITSRIKIMARLDIAERRLPQDGRIKLAVRGQEVDFRVSTIPSLHGETVVLRVLDRTTVAFDYGRLGLPRPWWRAGRGARPAERHRAGHGADRQRQDHHAVHRAAVAELGGAQGGHGRGPDRVPAAGVNQIQVKPQIGLNFATLLRSILRQDPDVIMVGEIRDLETAQIAVQAALTGHLVLSHGAHQLGRRHHPAAARHGAGGLPADRRAARHPGAAPGAAAVHALPARGGRPRRSWSSASAWTAGWRAAAAVAPGRLRAVPRHRLPRPAGDRRVPAARRRRSSG